jgi:hypothetical protein
VLRHKLCFRRTRFAGTTEAFNPRSVACYEMIEAIARISAHLEVPFVTLSERSSAHAHESGSGRSDLNWQVDHLEVS